MEKTLAINFILIIFLSCSTSIKKAVSDKPKEYQCKTYLFMGQVSEGSIKHKLETSNYSWKDTYLGEKLIQRFYPKYQGEIERTEEYEYDENDNIIKISAKMKSPFFNKITKDSTIFKYEDEFNYEKTKFVAGEYPSKEIYRKTGDTSYIDQIINGKYGFTLRAFRDSLNRKHSQVIKPKKSHIENIYVYNSKADLTQIIRIEKDILIEKSMTIEYEYDKQGRVTNKRTYYGDEMILGSREVRVYE